MKQEQKKFFKNKAQMVIYIIIFFILIWAFIFLGTRSYKTSVRTDNEQFDKEFTLVDKDNVFHYVTNTEARTLINQGNAIIFFGSNTSSWVNHYAKLLNNVAKSENIERINYYDYFKDRQNKNGTYESIVNKLSYYLKTNDEGVQNIYAPAVVIIKNGNIIYYDDETSFTSNNIDPDKYWTREKEEEKEQEFRQAFKAYLGE